MLLIGLVINFRHEERFNGVRLMELAVGDRAAGKVEAFERLGIIKFHEVCLDLDLYSDLDMGELLIA